MTSLKFPDIFKSTSTNVVKDLDATKQNTILLLYSEKGEFVHDPYFGIRLKRYIYEQNSYVIKDVIIDEIYTQLALFMPQLKVERKDINIFQDQEKAKIYCKFKAVNQIDFTTNTYNLVLYDEELM